MKRLAKQRLAFPLGVHVGRVVEVDPALEGQAQGVQQVVLRCALEDTAEAGAAEARLRHHQVGGTESSVSHADLVLYASAPSSADRFRSSASRCAARSANAMTVTVGFFSTPVV